MQGKKTQLVQLELQRISNLTLSCSQANPMIRDMFDLGPPGQDEYGQARSMSKAQRVGYYISSYLNSHSYISNKIC